MQCQIARPSNNRIQLTVKSVTFFAKQKNAPLFTSADAGVSIYQRISVMASAIALPSKGGTALPICFVTCVLLP